MIRRSLLGLFAGLGLTHQALSARDSTGPGRIEPLRLTDMQWRQRLTPRQYDVLRHESTEAPHTSPLNTEKRRGIYHCAGCNLTLFSSDMKFDSGTGWPSFFDSIPGAVLTKTDFKLLFPRTEYHCARCEGHQGHVFNDGPPPTKKCFCNNGAALKFVGAV